MAKNMVLNIRKQKRNEDILIPQNEWAKVMKTEFITNYCFSYCSQMYAWIYAIYVAYVYDDHYPLHNYMYTHILAQSAQISLTTMFCIL